MIACIKLKSATGSWTRAVGVRGECVTTQPPAPLEVAVRYGHGELGSASLYGDLGALPPSGVQDTAPGQGVLGLRLNFAILMSIDTWKYVDRSAGTHMTIFKKCRYGVLDRTGTL